MTNKDTFEAELEGRQRILNRARHQLETRLKQLTEDMSKVRNLRPRLVEARVKSLESLMEKARDEGWEAHEAFEKAGDLIGARIVCNNTADVYRMMQCVLECPDLESAKAQVEIPPDAPP